jgi:hypothetical protein
MLFTVIRYLPILEEETPGHRVEMSKKANPVNDGDDDTDDDDPDDEREDLFFSGNGHTVDGYGSEFRFYIKYHIYHTPVEKIQTPPPRI